jgi:HK97 family phage prohead protease
MLWGAQLGSIELRQDETTGGKRLRGRFPYGVPAVLSDGGRTGRPQKEIIAPRAFRYRIETPSDRDGGPEEIHLLAGHSFDRPLASVRAGTLALSDTDEALSFVATITPAIASTTWGRDTLAGIEAGLIVGVSPGFRIPPRRAVEVAEKVEEEPDRPEAGMHRALIRTVMQALLYEISLVTRPAYPTTEVQTEDRRSWELAQFGLAHPEGQAAGLRRTLRQWRS